MATLKIEVKERGNNVKEGVVMPDTEGIERGGDVRDCDWRRRQ